MTDADGFGLGPIHQIALPVGDAARAERFYREQLGMTHLYSFPDFAFFDAGGVRLMLSAPEPGRTFRPTESMVYFAVPDIQAAHAALTARGVAFEDEPHCVANLGATEVWLTAFRDSEGNPLALMSEVPSRQ